MALDILAMQQTAMTLAQVGSEATTPEAGESIWINVAYVIASVLFIMGLKGLAHPRTAVKGNLIGACGMLLAIVATLVDQQIVGYIWIVIGIVIGSVVGVVLAVKIAMTEMPQLVALYNGFGGLASVLVAWATLREISNAGLDKGTDYYIATMASGLIGGVTFLGSLVAFDKLQGWFLKKDIRFPGQKYMNLILFIACVLLSWWGVSSTEASELAYFLLVIVSLALGFFLVVPIGGADMPVVIALLNSYSGVAAAATGFVLNNNVLIIAGSLVGASGIILTRIMCKAMNRSLANVIFGTMGGEMAGVSGDEIYEGKIKSTSGEEIAMILDGAQRVVIVPGYGMAVSQAQHAVRDLTNLLEDKGIKVEFGIHPVAGRMPGHMNVLLAEADISYDKLIEMDQINPTMDQVDVAIVLGANDVVNPVARTDPNSPIAGMPIIDVDKARTVIMIKRSLSPGFAGIPNPLFAADNTLMFFSDGQKAIRDVIEACKEM